MARVEYRDVGPYRYVLVVEEVRDGPGPLRKKTIHSFGPAGVAANEVAAQNFAHAVNAAHSLKKLVNSPEDLEHALSSLLKGLVAAALIGALVTWVFGRGR